MMWEILIPAVSGLAGSLLQGWASRRRNSDIEDYLAQIISGRHPAFSLDINKELYPLVGALRAQQNALTNIATQNLLSRGLGSSGLQGAVARDIALATQAEIGRRAAALEADKLRAWQNALLTALTGRMNLERLRSGEYANLANAIGDWLKSLGSLAALYYLKQTGGEGGG